MREVVHHPHAPLPSHVQRPVQLRLLSKGHAQVVQGFGVARAQGQGALIGADALVDLACRGAVGWGERSCPVVVGSNAISSIKAAVAAAACRHRTSELACI
jgi:hypothetical protein